MKSLRFCYLMVPFLILSACNNDDPDGDLSVGDLSLSEVAGSWFGSFDNEGLGLFEGEVNFSGNVLITFQQEGTYTLALENLVPDTFTLKDEGTFDIQATTLTLVSTQCVSEDFSCQLSAKFSGKSIRLLEDGLQIFSDTPGDAHFYLSYSE